HRMIILVESLATHCLRFAKVFQICCVTAGISDLLTCRNLESTLSPVCLERVRIGFLTRRLIVFEVVPRWVLQALVLLECSAFAVNEWSCSFRYRSVSNCSDRFAVRGPGG